MDHAFASLLIGTDIESGEVLPGFGQARSGDMSRTDMVRCKSLVEATRVRVVEVMGGLKRPVEDASETSEEIGEETEVETETDIEGASTWDGEDDGHNMDVARVYENTLVQLGKSLSGSGGYDVSGGG